GVEDEKGLVRGAGELLGDYALDLAQLLHQVGLGMQAAGGVDDEHVGIARAGGFDGVEDDSAGVGAGLVADNGDAYALAPNLELVDGGGPEGVARADENALALVAVVFCDF